MLTLPLKGQGFSFSTYYDDEDHRGFVTNWDALQDTNGFIFVAVGDGLVYYNGVDWGFQHIGEGGRGTNLFISNGNSFLQVDRETSVIFIVIQ